MYLLLDTSTATCRVIFVEDAVKTEYEWQADREMAKGILKFLADCAAKQNTALSELKGIGVYRGPGSFTGLRIGITTANTIAASEGIPIVGTVDDHWHSQAVARLDAGENDQIVLPEYGRDARITTPRK